MPAFVGPSGSSGSDRLSGRLNLILAAASRADVRKDQRGAVLVVVLWVVVAISLLALSFSGSVRTEVDAARNIVEQKQAYYMARAGIEYSAYRLLEMQSAFFGAQSNQQLQLDATRPPVLTGRFSLELADGGVDVDVTDESGKVNVNMAPDNLIFNVLLMIGVPGQLADVITDSIGDWIDPDDLIRPFGAEGQYYASLELPYPVKNGFLDVPEELMLIQGITPEIYFGRKTTNDVGESVELYGLQHYFTTFGAVNRIDVNSAPIPVLAAIPGLDFGAAMLIDQIRSQEPLADVTELAQLVPGLDGEALNFLAVVRSGVYAVTSVGRVNGSRVVSRVRAVIRADGTGPKGYSVLYWNESNTEL